jgi:CDP-diacylglycerol--serine O-phosphatidyltransferase
MREFVNPANAITSGSLAAGFAALMLAGDGRLDWALAAVGVAALLDSVDGYVARRTSVCGPFGCHLDSLADLVAFGVAPALMLHHGVLGSVPGAGLCLAFVMAGAWRLARFPLIEDREHFIGLPIPPAGLVAAAVAFLAPPAAAAAVVCLLLALLMVSAFTVPTLAELGRLVRRRRTVRLVLVGGDHPPDGVRARERARPGGDDDERHREADDDQRVGAPALAGE